MSPDDPGHDLDEAIAGFRTVVGYKVRRALGAWNPEWEDVTNEILAQAVAKVRSGEFRGESSIGTFIFTITRRRIADYIRDKSRVLRHAPEPPPSPGPEALADRQERARRLTAAVRKLKPKYRDILYLYHFQGLSREETARKLGLTPIQVSDRASYARKLLRRLLGPSFFPSGKAGGD
ncbi:MAG: sigma-70 family RNA polymerase sigma factor [Candidatus Aminicenantes bacterium]|nr:sigma-70 family RNA polymerase sigma factor [Candidatus Aminicenantes bacterium]